MQANSGIPVHDNRALTAQRHCADGLEVLERISLNHGGRRFSSAEKHDVQLKFRFNDVNHIQLVACIGDRAYATFMMRVNHTGFTIQPSEGIPSRKVLEVMTWTLLVSGRGREALYQHLLQTSWGPATIEAAKRRTGIVTVLPVAQGRRGTIDSGDRRCELLLKESQGLFLGAKVKYTLVRDGHRYIAADVRRAA